MFQDSELETAYREGREAAKAGREKDNHYPPDSPRSFAWQVGWNQVEQEMRDAEEGQYIIQ